MIFKGERLSKKEENFINKILHGKLNEIINDIDYYTDEYGKVILITQREIENKLKEVI